jgi:transposase
VVLWRKIHQHIFNQRLTHQHKLVRMLVNQYGLIAVEDLTSKDSLAACCRKQFMMLRGHRSSQS